MWILITLIVQVLFLVYQVVVNTVSMFPFNDLQKFNRKELILESLFATCFMILPPIGLYFNILPLVKFSCLYYPFLLMMALRTWWLPYFKGTSPTWQRNYERLYADTKKILPARGENPNPDIRYILSHLMIVCATFLTWVSYLLIAD